MPLDKRELSYLWDMQNAAREISELMRNVKFHKFENDKFMRYAAKRLFRLADIHKQIMASKTNTLD